MIGVVVPCHNEEAWVAECVASILEACKHPELESENTRVVVVLDACTDDTAGRLAGLPVDIVRVDARNVGRARAAGAARQLEHGARWLAFTDADSIVHPRWLAAQLTLAADAVCGCVEVLDWTDHPELLRHRYEARYRFADGHRHVHGANLGVSADAYVRAGGFEPLRTGEDVALVRALCATGASIAWSASPRVATSTRLDGRAPEGFAALLQRLAQQAVNDPHDDLAA